MIIGSARNGHNRVKARVCTRGLIRLWNTELWHEIRSTRCRTSQAKSRLQKESDNKISHVQMCLQRSVSHSYEVDKFPPRIDPNLKQSERHLKDNL